jgi:CheY-like chemotaxis protein
MTASRPQEKKIASYDGPRRTIVVVDDNEDHREMMREILMPLDFVVLTAAGGTDCLTLIEGIQPDLFLVDISMPGMNGWQLVSRLREARPGAPIVMLSANIGDGRGPQPAIQPQRRDRQTRRYPPAARQAGGASRPQMDLRRHGAAGAKGQDRMRTMTKPRRRPCAGTDAAGRDRLHQGHRGKARRSRQGRGKSAVYRSFKLLCRRFRSSGYELPAPNIDEKVDSAGEWLCFRATSFCSWMTRRSAGLPDRCVGAIRILRTDRHVRHGRLNIVERITPDVILLDAVMPSMDGFETCRS